MKTKRAVKKQRKTKHMRGGSQMKHLVQDIINYAIKFRLRSGEEKFGIFNPQVYYRTLISSSCHKDIVKKLTNYVLKKINKDPNWANVWNNPEKPKRIKQLMNIILDHAGLYYSGLTHIGEDLGDFMNEFHYEMQDLDDNSNELMINYILYQGGVANKIDKLWRFNSFDNINKIKALIHKVPQIGDADTVEMLTEHFNDEIPDNVDVYPFSTGVKPFYLKDDDEPI